MITEVTKFLRYSRRKGYVREEHETIREAMKRWGEQRWWLNKELAVLRSIFEKAKYSKHELNAEEIEKSAKAIRKLREEMI